MDKIKVMSVFGTRPEAIKMAPLVKQLEKTPEIESIVCVTAQHREMLDQVLEIFDLHPQYDLNIMQSRQTLAGITTRALTGLEEVMGQEKPDIVLVHGDTSTTFAGALAAYYNQVKVGHVEAGLRTYDKYQPFPEEMNRKLTAAITDHHFAPTANAKANLLKENIKEDDIYVTGNTVIDALQATVKDSFDFHNPKLEEAIRSDHKLILMTTHRRENLGAPMRHVYQALKEVLKDNPDAEAIFPMHKNPKVREVAEAVLGKMERVHLLEPMDYEPFANLMARVDIVLTDSGGIQEEAPALGKPVLVLRNTTERPEAVTAGTVKLIGTGKEDVYAATSRLLNDEKYYRSMAEAVNPYGDGQAAKRIVTYLLHTHGYPVELMPEFHGGQDK